MKDTDPDRRGELTDAQLDQLLAETNKELLEHVEATSDPSRTLAAIVAQNDAQARPARVGLGRALAAIMGSRVRALASAVVRAGAALWRARLVKFFVVAVPVVALLVAAARLEVLTARALRHPFIFGSAIVPAGLAAAAAIILVISRSFAPRVMRVEISWHSRGQALACIMRSRVRALALARGLADLHDIVGFSRDDGGRDILYVTQRGEDRVADLGRTLDELRVTADALNRGLDHAADRALASDISLDLDRARDLVRELNRSDLWPGEDWQAIPVPTMAQRIVRAKKALSASGVPFEIPTGPDLAARLAPVLEVVYLVFNEGYTATSGLAWTRPALCDEAMRLGRILCALAPAEPETFGLVALMEIQASRLRARVGPGGRPVTLLDQDRGRWDRVLITHALGALARADELGGTGSYVLQASIAACHARAATAEDTDWARIASLYASLAARTGSPIVELNRAVAVSMAEGPAAGLAVVDGLRDAPALRGYHLLPSVRGDLLVKLGRPAEARAEFDAAAELTDNEAERRFLLERAAACSPGAAP